MSRIGSRAMYRSWNRDRNEKDITPILDRLHVRYHLMPPGAGFDILVMVGPVEFWEIKNSGYKWSLTKGEQETKKYCEARGITYRVIENIEQAANALVERT